MARTRLNLSLPDWLYAELASMAATNERSMNSQVVFMLKEQLREAERALT